jgi:hypothetical protein
MGEIMAPAESKRNIIFGLIIDALVKIQGGSSYFYKISADSINLIHGTRSDAGYQAPYIYIYPSYEQYDYNKGEKGMLYKSLGMDIEAWVRAESLPDMNENVNKMLHDIEVALVALTLVPQSTPIIDLRFINNVVYIEDLAAPLCAVVLSIEVDYETLYTDPSSG